MWGAVRLDGMLRNGWDFCAIKMLSGTWEKGCASGLLGENHQGMKLLSTSSHIAVKMRSTSNEVAGNKAASSYYVLSNLVSIRYYLASNKIPIRPQADVVIFDH
jgi:hypothetical protein